MARVIMLSLNLSAKEKTEVKRSQNGVQKQQNLKYSVKAGF